MEHPLRNSLFTLLFLLTFIGIGCSDQASENTKKTGVLILAHGSRDTTWTNNVYEATRSISEDYTVEVAFGMANPFSMQPAIDSLESKGIEQIVVVPLFVSSYSPIIRQNEYLLGFRDSLADAPMPPMRHEMTDEMMAKMDHMEHFELKPLKVNAEVKMTTPLDDHQLVAEILMDRIAAVSDDPSEETLLLVAHGPVSDQDNNNWLAAIDNLSSQIKEMQAEQGGEAFYNIVSHTVRDDASKEVYDQAKEEFRTLVIEANKHGEAIVIPLLLSKGGVERRYLTRLEGLEYTWGGEALLPHDNISRFIEESVHNALSSE
jgi:sirohydrochlorin ferrochelatase